MMRLPPPLSLLTGANEPAATDGVTTLLAFAVPLSGEEVATLTHSEQSYWTGWIRAVKWMVSVVGPGLASGRTKTARSRLRLESESEAAGVVGQAFPLLSLMGVAAKEAPCRYATLSTRAFPARTALGMANSKSLP